MTMVEKTSVLNSLEAKHGLMQRALNVLTSCNIALKKDITSSEKFYKELTDLQLQEEAEEVKYFKSDASFSNYFSDMEFYQIGNSENFSKENFIKENVDGIFTLENFNGTNPFLPDPSFQNLVKSVIH